MESRKKLHLLYYVRIKNGDSASNADSERMGGGLYFVVSFFAATFRKDFSDSI